jgi:hypothetical protein
MGMHMVVCVHSSWHWAVCVHSKPFTHKRVKKCVHTCKAVCVQAVCRQCACMAVCVHGSVRSWQCACMAVCVHGSVRAWQCACMAVCVAVYVHGTWQCACIQNPLQTSVHMAVFVNGSVRAFANNVHNSSYTAALSTQCTQQTVAQQKPFICELN